MPKGVEHWRFLDNMMFGGRVEGHRMPQGVEHRDNAEGWATGIPWKVIGCRKALSSRRGGRALPRSSVEGHLMPQGVEQIQPVAPPARVGSVEGHLMPKG